MDGEQVNPDCPGCRGLQKEVAELRRLVEEQSRVIEEQVRIIEELRRAGKRQAGPFSKGPPKLNPHFSHRA
jgi:transposase